MAVQFSYWRMVLFIIDQVWLVKDSLVYSFRLYPRNMGFVSMVYDAKLATGKQPSLISFQFEQKFKS